MPSFKNTGIISALAGAASVMAHGHVESVIADGVEYEAFRLQYFYTPNPPPLVGWSTTATDNGFVEPSQFTSGDIACHRDGAPADGHAVVAAGGEIFLQWDTWPESHKGPVIDMLASCGEDCASVEKGDLEFFKIQEVGLISGSGVEGTWASDELIANGNGWLVKIPETLAAGNYVLRHEIIALHASGEENGAQNYPQCINIQVTGGGSELPAGVAATSLYTPTDPGILFNLYSGQANSYEIPGPEAPAFAEVVSQSVPQATATSEPVIGGGSAPAPTPTSGSGDEEDSAAPAPTATTPVEDDSEEESAAPLPSATSPVEDGSEEETEAPAPVPSAPVEEDDEAVEQPEECPSAARRRARRAAKKARAARRHARREAKKARLARS